MVASSSDLKLTWNFEPAKTSALANVLSVSRDTAQKYKTSSTESQRKRISEGTLCVSECCTSVGHQQMGDRHSIKT